MKGDIYQLSRLVCYVKHSMKTGVESEFQMGKYENRLMFTFLPTKKIFLNNVEECYDVRSWYQHLQKRNIKNIHLLSFFEDNEIRHAGFANASKQGIVTEYEGGKVTFWAARWEFDQTIKEWNIYYKEFGWDNHIQVQYTFENCRTEFEQALLDIQRLAYEIECEFFGDVFKAAYGILTSPQNPLIPEWMEDTVPELDAEAMRLFLAASKADVFGAMGSWNDEPAWIAHKKGLEEEYKRLSRNLYDAMNKAVMNAVNGW